LPKQDGHLSGLGQGYALPRVKTSFTTTEKCSIKKPLLGRVIKVGELDNSAVMTLFLSSQTNTIFPIFYTKHRDKKIPLADNLLRGVTSLKQFRSSPSSKRRKRSSAAQEALEKAPTYPGSKRDANMTWGLS
jgi:hypothetical protein